MYVKCSVEMNAARVANMNICIASFNAYQTIKT